MLLEVLLSWGAELDGGKLVTMMLSAHALKLAESSCQNQLEKIEGC